MILKMLKKGLFILYNEGWGAFFYKAKRKFIKCRNDNKLEIINNCTEKELKAQTSIKFPYRPLISIIVPTFHTDRQFLVAMISSVQKQTYANWELCIADASIGNVQIRNTLREYAKNDPRIKLYFCEENYGISENSNKALALAKGEYIALLDHDDIIMPQALFMFVKAINENNRPDVLYSDEDKIDEKGIHKLPFLKPDWSRDLLETQMYIGHLILIQKQLLNSIGNFRKEYDGSQDYDLLLRISLQTDKIYHIPQVLYSWRESLTSTAANPESKPYAQMAGLNCLNDYLQTRYKGKAWAEETENLFIYDVRFKINNEKVSIIIPMKDHVEMTDKCINSILSKSSYTNYEIIIMNNHSEKEETYAWFKKIQEQFDRIKVIEANYEFNWSKLNNHGIKHAAGDVFIFLNNDILVISEDWIERLVENALREDVGVVGAMLLYDNHTIQHAGVVVGLGGYADHIFKTMEPINFASPYVSPIVNRNVLACTGACMAVSKKVIEKIGGFDETFIICGSDVELGLRSYAHNLRNLYNARVRLYHLESKTRDKYIPQVDFEQSKLHYGKFLANGDPFFNHNLSLETCVPTVKWR